MLVLGRNTGEKIIIGDDITISINKIKGIKAFVGITAPENISLHREEIYKRIQAEKGEKQNGNK